MTGLSFADRIKFLKDDQVMDVDFSSLTFESSGPVNDFYDEVDRRIAETGEVHVHSLGTKLEQIARDRMGATNRKDQDTFGLENPTAA